MILYLAGGQTGGNIPRTERNIILTIASYGGGFDQVKNDTLPCKSSHADEIFMEGKQCDCSWQGSPRGGAGGGTTL